MSRFPTTRPFFAPLIFVGALQVVGLLLFLGFADAWRSLGTGRTSSP